jgi:hypothetical protein
MSELAKYQYGLNEGHVFEYDKINHDYQTMKDLIYSTIHKFAAKREMSIDLFEEHINTWFMIAKLDFNPDGFVKKYKGKKIKPTFGTYLVWVVNKGCYDVLRDWARRDRIVKWHPLTDLYIQTPKGFDALELIRDMTEDSKTVVMLVIKTPPGLADIIEREGGKPKHYRECIMEYLDGLGWAASRITQSFKEITEALR